jgi:hypothetical protein
MRLAIRPWPLVALLAAACGSAAPEIPAPTPQSVAPSSGYAGQQVGIQISGANFLARTDGSAVDTRQRAWLDGLELVEVTWVDSKTITAIVPAAITPGVKLLRVENAYGASGSLPAAFTVEKIPAGLAAAIAAGPSADVGQSIAVSFTVTNGGTGAATVTGVAPSATGAAASCDAPTPALPLTLAPGASQLLGWSCTGSEAGALSLSGTVSGTDVTTGQPLSAVALAPAQVAVQAPAALAASVSVDGAPASLTVGQAFTLRLSASNPGGAATRLTALAVTPLASGCGAPSPALPQAIPGGGAVAVTFACAAIQAGTLAPAVSLTGEDGNTGDLLTASATLAPAVAVQAPAQLTAAVAADATVLRAGQAVHVTFTVTNGAASHPATVNSLASWATGSGAAICTGPSYTPGISIPTGGSRSFAWTCTATVAGNLFLGGTLNYTQSGAPGSASPAAPLAVTVTP